MHLERLGHDVAHVHAGVERGVVVLKDHLHAPAQRPHLRGRERRDVSPLEEEAPRARLDQLQQEAPERALAAARLAHQPERAPRRERERHAVDRAQRAPPEEPAPRPKLFAEPLGLEQRRRAHGRAPAASFA
jgi:hypothetical protein